MKKSELGLYYEENRIGTLRETAQNTIEFSYAPEWLTNVERFPISHSLPLLAKNFGQEAQNYFANLLPEGDVRVAVAAKLGVSAENDFRLLEKLGGECAGALTIGHEPLPLEADYHQLASGWLKTTYENGLSVLAGLQDEQQDIRLSLAGAQDKLPVYYQNAQMFLPHGNSPSSHILKLPSHRLKYLPENECFTAMFARGMGLDVAPSQLIEIDGLRAYLVERYDRQKEDSGKLRRLHQEDFCQSLGVSHKVKYEGDKGPTYKACYESLEQSSFLLPEDLDRLLQWLVFNVIAANCDAHAKNISLLMTGPDLWMLSPHYDLVCTKAYRLHSPNLAMSIGGAVDSGTVTGTHWRRLANEIQVAEKFLLQMVEEMSERSLEVFDTVAGDFAQQYGASPVIADIRKIVHEQRRRLLSQLKK